MIDILKKLGNKIKIGKLFYNNKFIAVFSVVCSFVLWVAVSSSSTQDIPVTISDIPVEISLSESAVEDGLRIFSGQDVTARVEIKGSRMVVGQVTKNDIQVTAAQAANTIMSPGNYTLELSAKKVGMISDYEIVSDVKPSMITVMVDRYREANFTVEPEINFTAKDGLFVGSAVLSKPEVKISGPESEISKIKKVVVKGEIQGEVSETIDMTLPIIMYDAYGQQINSETITSSSSEVEVSIPILTKKEISLVPKFSNIPSDIDLSSIVKVNPKKLEIAGPKEIVSGLNDVSLPEIDFRNLSMQNHKFGLSVTLPQGCRSLNNEYEAQVSVDMSSFKEKNLAINRFSFVNVPKDKTAKVYNDSISINFIGPISSINALKPSDIVAQIDLEGKEDTSNSMEMPVKLIIENFKNIWVYDKYNVNVSLSDNK